MKVMEIKSLTKNYVHMQFNYIFRIPFDCITSIKIPVYDPDDDVVSCRWAAGIECGGVCNGLPKTNLDTVRIFSYSFLQITVMRTILLISSRIFNTNILFLIYVNIIYALKSLLDGV